MIYLQDAWYIHKKNNFSFHLSLLSICIYKDNHSNLYWTNPYRLFHNILTLDVHMSIFNEIQLKFCYLMTMNLEKHTQLIYCKINNPYKEISIRTIEDILEIKSNQVIHMKYYHSYILNSYAKARLKLYPTPTQPHFRVQHRQSTSYIISTSIYKDLSIWWISSYKKLKMNNNYISTTYKFSTFIKFFLPNFNLLRLHTYFYFNLYFISSFIHCFTKIWFKLSLYY